MAKQSGKRYKLKAKSTRLKKSNLEIKKLFKDRLFRWFVWTAILLCLATLTLLGLKVRRLEFAVPLRYSTWQGFDGLGAWYRIYVYGIFGLIITAGNLLLAAHGYDKSRIASFFLVMGTVFINLFLLVIVVILISNLEI